ncbi:hypothetical protein [Bradyrhizobium macuxiense]|uniref:hypothetical protein n=1 Tax=Bradyrhizobium macuxiense TaxID=1755647 RepID=UPI0010A95F85|nr:hypothetical protein [Bradyrhizobium macuxiense]
MNMRKGLYLFLGVLIGSTYIGAGAASAQNAKSYVSSTGSDSNPCTFALPCRTFQHGHDQTNTGGELYALDNAADYGALVINRGIAIFSPQDSGATRASISVASGSAITVNAPANATVTLVNLELRGQGTADNGVLFNTGALLQVYGGSYCCFGGAAPNGFGVKFAPSAFSRLLVSGANISGNGTASTGAAVQVNPQSGGAAYVNLREITAYNNAFGLAMDTTGSTNGVNSVIHGGTMQYNRQDGIVAVGGAPIGLLIDDNALLLGNAGFGVRAIGTGVNVRLNQANIVGNGTGVAGVSGGSILSYGNNSIDGNGTNGTPTSTIPLK